MTDAETGGDGSRWRFTDPTADFDRSDWQSVAVSVLIMLGIGGVCAAVALRVAAPDLLPAGCATSGTTLSASYCQRFIRTVNHYISVTLWPGATLLVTGAILNRRWEDA